MTGIRPTARRINAIESRYLFKSRQTFGSGIDSADSGSVVNIFESDEGIIGVLDPNLIVVEMNSSLSLVFGGGQDNSDIILVVVWDSRNKVIEVRVFRSNKSHFSQP